MKLTDKEMNNPELMKLIYKSQYYKDKQQICHLRMRWDCFKKELLKELKSYPILKNIIR